MASWGEFAASAPEMAAYGQARFNRNHVAFMATLRSDGSPRIHPVTPVLCQRHLMVFIDPASAMARDLRRDGRCALHSLVDNPSGVGGEFHVHATAAEIADTDTRRQAVESSCFTPSPGHTLFLLDLESVHITNWENGRAEQTTWAPAQVASV